MDARVALLSNLHLRPDVYCRGKGVYSLLEGQPGKEEKGMEATSLGLTPGGGPNPGHIYQFFF